MVLLRRMQDANDLPDKCIDDEDFSMIGNGGMSHSVVAQDVDFGGSKDVLTGRNAGILPISVYIAHEI